MEPVLEAFGVRIRRVADLDEQALYLPRFDSCCSIVTLTDRQVSAAIDDVLPRLGQLAA